MKVFILCDNGNSCRSLMAEAFLLQFDQSLEVFSAGLNPHDQVDPFAILVMNEIGIDISNNLPKSYTLFEGTFVDYLITLCDRTKKEISPVSILFKHKINLEFDNPGKETSSSRKDIEMYREIRDEIRHELHYFYSRILKRELTHHQ